MSTVVNLNLKLFHNHLLNIDKNTLNLLIKYTQSICRPAGRSGLSLRINKNLIERVIRNIHIEYKVVHLNIQQNYKKKEILFNILI